MALDGGTRPGDTLQILPLALAQPPNPRSIVSHSVLNGHPSLTHPVGFFRGILWGIDTQKIIIGTAICFLIKYAFQMKKIKHTHYIYIYKYKYIYKYINLLCSLCVIIKCMHIHLYTYIYIYIFFIRIYTCVCVLKLLNNLKSIVNLSSLQ